MPVARVKAPPLTDGGFTVSEGAVRYALTTLALSRRDLSNLLDTCVRVSGSSLGNYRTRDYFFKIDGKLVVAIKKAGEAASTIDKHPTNRHNERNGGEYHMLRPGRSHHGECGYCDGAKKHLAYNECGACFGAGCKKCEGGFVPVTIPCQFCNPKKGR